jgi:gamma-glutamyltranspeptidase/glutathione hydrolase
MQMLGRFTTWFVVAVLTIVQLEAASRTPARGQHGMVVSVCPIASKIGVDILKQGGNAMDAAVAVGFALAVTWPSAGNIGGGGFMIVHDAHSGEDVAIDYREMAPAAAHRDMYLDSNGQLDADRSTRGHLAVGVPGTVGGLLLVLERYGALDRRTVLAPAIRLADEGFPVSYHLARSLKGGKGRLGDFPESKRIFLDEGRFYQEGDLLVQKDLAKMLRLIAARGREGFYDGEVARLVAEEMKTHGGAITADDMKNYRPKVREPVVGTYRGHTVVSMPPPSSGGTILIEMLNMIEPEDVASLGHNSSAGIHMLTEVMKRAFADRAEFMGDADFSPVPYRALITKSYARKRRVGIDAKRATPSKRIRNGKPQPAESEETTHFSVIDKDGNAVSNTYTLNSSYGSGVAVTGAGFLLNNQMDNFAAKVGSPNQYGLLQGEANAIEAGKRPLSSMSPTIVLQDSKVRLVAGTPGGPTIINTVFQVIVNVVDHQMTIQEAVDAPRVHHQWMPDRLRFERKGLVRDVRETLEAKGHDLEVSSPIGDAHAIYVDPKTGIRLGGADPRRGGEAAAY